MVSDGILNKPQYSKLLLLATVAVVKGFASSLTRFILLWFESEKDVNILLKAIRYSKPLGKEGREVSRLLDTFKLLRLLGSDDSDVSLLFSQFI